MYLDNESNNCSFIECKQVKGSSQIMNKKADFLQHSWQHLIDIDVTDCSMIWITQGANTYSDMNFITIHIQTGGRSEALR